MQTEKQKAWYEANKERIKVKRKEYYDTNKPKVKQYRTENKDKIRDSNYEYYVKNKELINLKRNSKHKEKIQSDSLYRVKHNIRGMLGRVFKARKLDKLTKSEIILGCTFEEFKTYLESQFESWMNWDNYALYNGEANHGWDIDHIIPLSTAITVEDVLKLNHYSNLQPLCSYTNRYVKRDLIL